MHLYSFHGVRIQTQIDLGLPSRSGLIKQKTLSIQERPRHANTGALAFPFWKSDLAFDDGTPCFRLYRSGKEVTYEIGKVGCFTYYEDRVEVQAEPEAFLPPYLTGRIFTLWLELQGIPVLHGSSVVHGEKCLGFLAFKGSGKSTTSAYFSHRGHALVTDDLIPIRPNLTNHPYLIDPGIPQSRLWPDSGSLLVEDFHECELVHPLLKKKRVPDVPGKRERFTNRPYPLAALILLKRGEALEFPKPQLQRMAPAESLLALIAQSQLAQETEALGLVGQRMTALSRLVEKIPVYKLCYPSGLDRLEEVYDCVIAHRFPEPAPEYITSYKGPS